MHIPDGYLSPSTCAVLYAGAAPFWVIALRRLRRTLNARVVPVLSLLAAFSFVVMMFNIPLPGGTTGHAVGMTIAAIVLGPWASIIALSVALFIQAVFFGDGGITAFGANCFNMAVIGSLTAWALYRLLAGRSALDSPRRVAAAALAGYAALNVSALAAAIEFGLQPALFHNAAGMPLYAPYPLAVAVPAMMLGHLTFAGLAEAVISGSLVAYLQRANPELLRPTAGLGHSAGSWNMTRPLWAGLALLMILSPLGLLAAGTAWGEWSAEDFAQPEARRDITAASRQVHPPEQAPEGLARLSSFWTAPVPDYAPAFLKNPAFGYILSAMLGGGAVIAACLLVHWMLSLRGSAGETAGAP